MHLGAFKCLKNAENNETILPHLRKWRQCAAIHSLPPELLFYLFLYAIAYPSKPPPAELSEGGGGRSESGGISEICKSNHFQQRQWRHINKPLHWRLTAFFSLAACCILSSIMVEKCKAGAKVIVIGCFSLSFPVIRPNYDCAKRKWRGGKK